MGLLGKSAKKQLASLQFAVLDFETSGLEASEHRVIEAALVLMNGAGTVEHEWTTLVNPGDAKSGSKKIHGIDDTWLAAAPTFGSVIGDIRDRITGRVLVAHNHAFDLGFLRSELLRAGIAEGVELLFLDTMDLAEALGLPKRLQDACAEVGITYAAHNALEDARATAQLLAALLERVDPSTFANNPVVPPNWLTTSVAATGAYMWRDSAAQLTTAKDIVASIGFHLPPQPPSPERDLAWFDPYRERVTRALGDDFVSPHELHELTQIAIALTMTPHDLRRVHHDVFLAKIDTTIMAGSLTKAAKANLNRHAGWLGVDATDMDEMIKAARKRVKLNQKAFRDSLSGQSICFIGRGLHPTNIRQALCEKNGIVFQSTVNASTSMLVKGNDMATSASVTAAETNSLPTMLEADFWRQLGE